jgi:cysteine synthase A
MVCAAKGYPLVVVMAENFSIERRKILRFLGAKVVLTPAPMRGTGMLAKAVELAEAHGWFLCRQFENESNADVHSRTTAPEILEAFEGERLDYWITGFGTAGTLKGVSRVLKKERPETQVVVCEPDNSGILGSGIAQERESDGAPAGSHPGFRTHPIQGWSPDFIPKLAEDTQSAELIDVIQPISSADAMRLSRELATKEGIFTGISGGATFAGALEVCRDAPAGTTVLCMLPDTGERYLTTPLFDGIAEEMTDEEIEISRSTPNYRFDAPPAAAANASAEAPVASEKARAFVADALADRDNSVVMFALEWCEFCWSVRKLFKAYGIPYRSIDLDTAEFQQDDWGGEIRAALLEKTSSGTVPQIFVGGEYVGGCTETLDAFGEGSFQQRLSRHGVAFEHELKMDPYKFFPAWLHPRAPQ